jgi:hypothetical protein
LPHHICLSFDLEEFDMPLEYGQHIPFDEQLSKANEGVLPLLDVLHKYQITATFFITANYANHNKDIVKRIAQSHEVASHGLYHSSFKVQDLLQSRIILAEISGQKVTGFRMARMAAVSNTDVLNAGYTYNSSLNPTYIPGRYNHFFEPRNIHTKEQLIIVPASVSPIIRFPLFWLSFKNVKPIVYNWLCATTLAKDGVLNVYFHPHEFADISSYALPNYTKTPCGKPLLDRLENFISYMKPLGTFTTIEQHLASITN